MERILLRPVEAAEMLGLSRAQVYVLCARGLLPSVRIGTSVRLPAESVLELIKTLQREAESTPPAGIGA